MSKRALLFVLLGLLAATIIACGGGGEENGGEQAEDSVPESTVSAPQPTLIPGNPRLPNPTAAAPTEIPTATPVATEGDFFLQLVSPAELETITDVGTLAVVGRTRVDAVVTIDDTIVEPDIDGEFSLEVSLEEGPNIIEVVASVASGEQMDLVLVAIYLP